jgi:hypothetical protein
MKGLIRILFAFILAVMAATCVAATSPFPSSAEHSDSPPGIFATADAPSVTPTEGHQVIDIDAEVTPVDRESESLLTSAATSEGQPPDVERARTKVRSVVPLSYVACGAPFAIRIRRR